MGDTLESGMEVEVEASNSEENIKPEDFTSAKDFTLADQVALVKALVFAHGEPISLELLCTSSGLDPDQLRNAISHIKEEFNAEAHGFRLVEVGGRYQFRTEGRFAEFISQLKASKPRRLSVQALETLAIIAYRQPILKSDIEMLRGVDATPTLKTLLERDLVKIVGHQPTVGQPALYATTDGFLEIFGLKSLEALPPLKDFKELADPGESQLA